MSISPKLVPHCQPSMRAKASSPKIARPTDLTPALSPKGPITIRRSEPPSKGMPTNTPFWKAERPNSSDMAILRAPTKSQIIKLTSKCNHAPSKLGQ